MVCQYIFHNDEIQEYEHNLICMRDKMFHSMMYNWDMLRDMKDIGKCWKRDKILVNTPQHKSGIEDKDISSLNHKMYIGKIEIHYMLNIENHTIDS